MNNSAAMLGNQQVLDTFNEQQRNTVYDEVCDSAQPSYGGNVGASGCFCGNPQGNAGGVLSGYGAAADPSCRQAVMQQGSTTGSKTRLLECAYKILHFYPIQQSQSVPRKQCTTVSKENCRNVPRQKYRSVPRQSCQSTPSKVPRQECKSVGTVQQHPQAGAQQCF